MKNIIRYTLMGILISWSFIANGQEEGRNISNQYGPPTYTGGTVNTPSEAYAAWHQYNRQANRQAMVTEIYTVFPNPARTSASVVLAEQANDRVLLYVINMNGSVVRTYAYGPGGNRLDFDVSTLPNGIYSIQVQERGKDMQSIKLMKEE